MERTKKGSGLFSEQNLNFVASIHSSFLLSVFIVFQQAVWLPNTRQKWRNSLVWKTKTFLAEFTDANKYYVCVRVCVCVRERELTSNANLCLNPDKELPRRQNLEVGGRWEWESKKSKEIKKRMNGGREEGREQEQVRRRMTAGRDGSKNNGRGAESEKGECLLGDWGRIGRKRGLHKVEKERVSKETKRQTDGESWGTGDWKEFGEEMMRKREDGKSETDEVSKVKKLTVIVWGLISVTHSKKLQMYCLIYTKCLKLSN